MQAGSHCGSFRRFQGIPEAKLYIGTLKIVDIILIHIAVSRTFSIMGEGRSSFAIL
jgi:hypothetical protein